MTDLIWPERPTCHDQDWQAARFGPVEWHEPMAGRPFRFCSYCGSIHPAELLALVEKHPDANFEVADWKYGWPHKVYVTGSGSPVKWYNIHLRDLADDAFTRLADLIAQRCGIRFEVQGDQLAYKSEAIR